MNNVINVFVIKYGSPVKQDTLASKKLLKDLSPAFSVNIARARVTHVPLSLNYSALKSIASVQKIKIGFKNGCFFGNILDINKCFNDTFRLTLLN